MNQPGVSIEEIAVKRILSTFPDVKGIYLFGSRAFGKHRPDSDYDMAVLADEPLEGTDTFFALQLELAADSGVHLVDLRTAPTVLQFEVLRGRKRLYCSDREYCIDFEAYILSAYQHFNEQRRPIIERMLQRQEERAKYAEQQTNR